MIREKMNVIKVCDAGAVWWHVTKGEMQGEFETVADYIPDEETAWLIAAAPELLEACQVAVKEINAWRSGNNSRVALTDSSKAKVGSCYGGLLYANTAITKATGKAAA